MLVVIRVDAGIEMGIGHAARCLQLALRLRMRGATVYFASDNKAVEQLVSPHGFILLKTQNDIAALEQKIDWIILDHPMLDIGYERIMQEYAGKLMVIDDSARHHDCDLLFDQNAGDDNRYEGKLYDNTIQCIGTDYSLIDKSYHEVTNQPNNNAITIAFGGTDPHGLTIQTLAALDAQESDIHIIVGAQNPAIEKIKLLASDRSNWHVHHDLNAQKIATLYAKSRFAIGCGGGMLWERLAVGIPSIEMSLDAQHDALLMPLHRDNHIHYIGSIADIFEKTLSDCCEEWLRQTPAFTPLKIGHKVEELLDILCG